MAAACTLTPAAALPPLLPTPCHVAGCYSERSAWGSKRPGRALASESWTRDKLLARTSSSLPGRASLSENWAKDKAERKEASIVVERVGRLPSRERRVGAKRASSRAPSVELDRSEKKAKPEEDDVKAVVKVKLFAGPGFAKSPDPSEVPLPKFPLFVRSPDPSQLPMPGFLNLKAVATTEAGTN
ncbi:unnamed protein product [Urochloa humidicola]